MLSIDFICWEAARMELALFFEVFEGEVDKIGGDKDLFLRVDGGDLLKGAYLD